MFNNAAQAWNHSFYWDCMSSNGGGEPKGRRGEHSWTITFRVFLCEEMAEQLLGSAVGRGKRRKASGMDSLSDRELEVFLLIGQGLTTSRIALRLRRSVNTVESHHQTIKDKLALKTASELNRAAVQWTLENG